MGFTLFSFDWGQGDLEGRTLEDWQVKLLSDIRDGLMTVNEALQFLDEVLQFARGSGHGIGKSAVVAIIILWAISTKINTRGIVTANTDTQLRTKTWPEVYKWHSRFIGKHLFDVTATAIFAKEKGAEKNWRIDAIPWSEHNTEAFAGLHNQGNRTIVIFDEASGIHDKIWEVIEGALTDDFTQRLWLAFGNRTRNVGRFSDCFKRYRHRWNHDCIDSRTVSFTDKKQIEKWQQDYGDDSDFFKVRVKGEEPSSGEMQFIPSYLIDAARGKSFSKHLHAYAPVIIGVDPAYSGTDEFVIYMRQGLVATMLGKYQKIEDDVLAAGYIARFEDEYKADAVFVDMGYGTGIVSVGRSLGRKWQLIPFASESLDPQYLNKRAEIWGLTKQWLKEGGCLPDDETICMELAAPEFGIKLNGKIKLEDKDEVKKRLGFSPNRADALALTFSFPINKKIRDQIPAARPKRKVFDPLNR